MATGTGYREGMPDNDPNHTYRLTVTGLVEKPESYDLERLSQLGESGEGTHESAIPLERVIADSRPAVAATHVTASSADLAYSASIPLREAMDKGEIHVIEAPGIEPQLRLLVPGGKTLCWNVKGLGLLKVTEGPEPDSLPEVLTH